MRIERVVVDASPLIVLFKSGLADLLPGLFAQVIVPMPVRHEVLVPGQVDAATTGLAGARWTTSVEDLPIPPTIAAWDLGAGESSVLAYALNQHGVWAMLDDRAARSCARTLQIRTLGTVGLIVLAKRRGLIPSARKALANVTDAGCWLAPDVVRAALIEAAEV